MTWPLVLQVGGVSSVSSVSSDFWGIEHVLFLRDVSMYVCMYVCMYERMYVCSCMCVTNWRVKDAACERWCVCVCDQCRPFFRQRCNVSCSACGKALRTWNRLNEVFHDLLCYEMCYVTTTPFLQPRIRRWWHRGKVPGQICQPTTNFRNTQAS